MMHIVILGPYGSGKGTQSKLLAEKYDLEIFDTGAELRKEMNRQTTLGKIIEQTYTQGNLISGETLTQVLDQFLFNHQTSQGFVFDAVPRNFSQKKVFDSIMKKYNWDFCIIVIDISAELSYKRQISRKEKREIDKKPEIISRRLNVYEEEVFPVIEEYRKEKDVLTIDGSLPIKKIHETIVNYIESQNIK